MSWLGETRQLSRSLVALTLPILGSASNMSRIFAVSSHAGGVEQQRVDRRRAGP